MKLPRPKRVKKKRPKLPQGYDSQFEYDLHNKQLKGVDWKCPPIAYVCKHVYHPDARFIESDGTELLIEIKGRFRTALEASKYVHVSHALEYNQKLVFVLYDRGTRMPRARKRKDGTYDTMEDWCTRNDFEYFYTDTCPKGWSKCRK